MQQMEDSGPESGSTSSAADIHETLLASVPRDVAAALNPIIDHTRIHGTLENVADLVSAIGYAVSSEETRDSIALHDRAYLLTKVLSMGLRWELAHLPTPAQRASDKQ